MDTDSCGQIDDDDYVLAGSEVKASDGPWEHNDFSSPWLSSTGA